MKCIGENLMSYSSKAGYIGGILFALTAIVNYFFEQSHFQSVIGSISRNEALLAYVLFCFLGMLLYEWWAVTRYNRINSLSHSVYRKNQSNFYLLKSAFFRVLSIGILFYISYLIVKHHYYFQHQSFNITRSYYEYLLYIYLLGSMPYCFYTLKYKGGSHYEFNDYGVLLMISYRTVYRWLLLKFISIISYEKNSGISISLKRLKNKRIIKVYLVFLVNFFFLTLMTKFFAQEYSAFHVALTKITSNAYMVFNDFQKFHAWYLVVFHLIFYIDVGVALIGYTVASRWLNNRTKSVDMTLYGWFVVLLCYPPMNAGFSDQFIGYGRFATHEVVTSETIKMILMSLILLSFSIYVWATLALGFKFSNLTNRGIISHGPYRFFRHPAYTTKNFAWWLDNTHILSSIWASGALLTWNVIYILRGITEEKHLSKDAKYQQYMKQVRNRFIPKLFYNKK